MSILIDNRTRHTAAAAKSTTTSTPDSDQALASAQSARDVISRLWAANTMMRRARLIEDWHEWVRNRSKMTLDWSLVTFIESKSIGLVSKATYARELATMLNRFNIETPILRMYLSGLNKIGALVPLHQARPLTPEHLGVAMKLLQNDPSRLQLRVGLFLAWKTASRWDEVARLRRSSIHKITDTDLTIWWSAGTKTTGAEPYAARAIAVCRHLPALPKFLTQYLSTLRADDYVVQVSTDRASAWMRDNIPVKDNEDHFTASSIKRGAVTHLVRHAAAGSIDLQVVSRMAKHKHQLDEISPTTLRYVAQDCIDELAHALRTQEASVLLPVPDAE